MRILLTGASGFIGRRLTRALLQAGHALVLAGRHRPPDLALLPGVEWHTMDFAKACAPQAWRPLLDGVEVVINAAGIFHETPGQRFADVHVRAPVALFRAARQAGVRRIIQISALGADERAASAFLRSKRQADDALAAMGGEWVILRPSLIIGGDGASWLFFRALALMPLVPLVGDGRQIVQPVSIDDVVRAVLRALESDAATGRRIDLVGREALTFRDWLHRLALWQGRRRVFTFSLPPALAMRLAAMGGLMADVPLTGEAIAMLQTARRHDPEGCRRALGFVPEGAADFLRRTVTTRADLQAARLYFLLPLLRISLALLWIATGLVSLLPAAREAGMPLLAALGLEGTAGLIAQTGAAVLDLLLGLMLLLRRRVRQVAALQLGLIAGYTSALTAVAPAMWADPFGPLAKNVPLFVATLILRRQPA